MTITVVGTVALDTITTPFGKVKEYLGGSAMFFSVAAGFFTSVNLVAVVGGDFPKQNIDFLRSRKVNLDGLEIKPEGKTFRWVGSYGHDLNNAQTLETQLNVIENYQPKIPASCKNPEILFLANIDPDQQQSVIDQSGKPGFIALDTMNLWIKTKKKSLIEAIQRVDLVTINESEARLLTGTANLVRAAKEIQSFGPKTVVIKRGEYGAILFSDDQIFCAPALPLEELNDPTGAGDSFAGGMMGYLDRWKNITFDNLKTSIITGSVMASFNVEKFSCDRLKEISMKDIMDRFVQFEALSYFEAMQV